MIVDPTYYTYVQKNNLEGIKILKPKEWMGTIFTFDLDINHPQENGQVAVQMDYKVLVTAPGKKIEDYSSAEFSELAEEIAKSMLFEIGDML